MNGGHDLGGAHGLGPIDPEPEHEEPVFHAEWEKRALGLTLLAGLLRQWNIDISRHARERQHPVDYLSNSYYENWLAGLETLLKETGMVTAEELSSGNVETSAPVGLDKKCVKASEIIAILEAGSPSHKASVTAQLFDVGDWVQVKLFNPTGHTRAPRYVRGHKGIISEYYGSHIFPDESAKGKTIGEPLYNVVFEGQDLWGDDNDSTIHVDLWQDYLEKPS